jgi:hypothetical protein
VVGVQQLQVKTLTHGIALTPIVKMGYGLPGV